MTLYELYKQNITSHIFTNGVEYYGDESGEKYKVTKTTKKTGILAKSIIIAEIERSEKE